MQVGAALGISFKLADIPREDLAAAPVSKTVAAPAITRIVAPDELPVRLAANAVAEALAGRGEARPDIVARAQTGRQATLRVELAGDDGGEAYRLSRRGGDLVLRAGR